MNIEFDNLKELLEEISDEAAHIIGTEAESHREVAIQNAKRIKELARQGRVLVNRGYNNLERAKCRMDSLLG